MFKNLLIVVLLLALGFAGYKWYMYRNAYKLLMAEQSAGSSRNQRRTGPTPLQKGENFMSSSLYKYAVQIYPGTLGQQAKTALNNFDMKTSAMSDGSTKVTLTPKESTDQFQEYVVKNGQTLYFIEMTKNDDKNGSDINLRDDYGVIVDGTGMVQ
ncbi:hypothetical protein M1328_04165 [Patescibacteria group bacterium]|nr:hypothetical protein [Patescibacteria group bacterium]